ncbi:MAG TPA: virulence-associated E family protein [Clostridia bacterium]|nr:virulence-associated E family protein [Clostridia bacterium]
MRYDRQIIISTAGSRRATKWPPSTLWWSELVERLRVPTRGVETLAAYLAMPKAKQDELKDVGGFVAGTLQGNRRKAKAVTGRDVVTIDEDSIPAGSTADVLRRMDGLGCAYCVYSTRKHEEARPRLRILLPLSRTCTADEYEPVARKLAALIGMELCDPTTFEASRLMYFPSCCADSQYVFTFGDKPFVDVDGVLAMYRDWRNVAEWPQVPGVDQAQQRLAAKQGDPTAKQGVVGAFCRTYDIYRAMDELLPGAYTPTDIPDRYTFAGGSTTGGAVVYDHGQFLFSHHATDPCSGKLVNAFDLVRLHRFSDMDDDSLQNTPTNRLPSYTAMCQLAVADSAVAALLNTERYEAAVETFTGSPLPATADEEPANWMGKLAISATTGAPAKTTDNVLIILEHDPLLKGRLAFDEFANRGLALDALPWDGRTGRRQWTDNDDAGMRHYIEKVYGITGKERILDATALCAFKRRINDVQDYLSAREWDGVKRLDALLIEYLGAEDNLYTRAVMRKSLTGAVARAMVPGVKYDYMPILTGPQGIGKSTFLRLLGRRWYSDSLSTFEGKEAREMVQGTWINEIGELNGMTRSEITAVKQFLSQQEDIYREPYGRRTNNYPRRCVFFGTTNDAEFLRDRTGNRRFWPVDVGRRQPRKSVFKDLADEVDQIWAEAFVAWQLGEPLYLSGEAERISMEQQEEHRESNAKEGIVHEFLDRPVPLDWEKRTISERRLYWSGNFSAGSVETKMRDKICAAEIWCECFGGDLKFMKRSDSAELYGILTGLKEWERHASTQRFGPYGVQKGFVRSVNL